MSEENLTPQRDSEATPEPVSEVQSVTPEDGTETPTQEVSASVETPPESVPYQEYIKIREQLKNSTQGAQKLYQEHQELKGYMQRLLEESKPQSGTTPETPEVEIPSGSSLLTREELLKQANANLEGDVETLEQLESLKESRRQAKARKEQEVSRKKQSKIQAAITSLQRTAPELRDKTSAIYKKTVEKYKELQSDPFLGSVYEDGPKVGNYNIALLERAALEAKAELGVAHKTASRVGEEYFTEPSTTAPVTTGPNLNKLLSEQEKAMAMKLKDRDPNYKENPYKRYWEQLEKTYPGIQKARTQAGRPLTYVRGHFV